MFQTQENPLGLPRGSTVAFVRTRWRCVSPRVAARAPRRKAGWPPRGYNNNTSRSSSAFHRRPYGRRISLSTPVFWGQRRWRPLRHCCHLPCLNSEAPWIPAFAGISHVGLTPHTTTDESWRAGRALPSAGSGQASPGSGAWVPVSSTRMTEGGRGENFRGELADTYRNDGRGHAKVSAGHTGSCGASAGDAISKASSVHASIE